MNRPRRLDRRGFLSLLRAAKDRRRLTARRDFFLLYFAGRTGLRASECLALRVKDLEILIDPPFVWVDSLKQRPRRIAAIGGGKRTIGPRRDQVLLEPRVVKRTRTYLRRVLPDILRREVFGADYVFPAQRRRSGWVSSAGNASVAPPTRPMSLRNLDRLFSFYARRVGLRPGISFHSLRHYRAMTLYTVSKHDLEFTRQQLRHRDLRTTQVYLGVDPETERRYIERLDRRS